MLTRESFKFFSVQLVPYCNLDLSQLVENIEFGEVEVVIAIDQLRVLEDHKVEPAGATSTSSRGPVFMANFLEMNANILTSCSTS